MSEPKHAHGRSLLEYINDSDKQGHEAYAYRQQNQTLRMGNFRLTRFSNKGHVLYELSSNEQETKNVASEHPEVVEKMLKILDSKMALNDTF
ncbi:alkaline phosphatase family protein [Aliiglaciecola lipolytica]|uniref:Uncharacterized protein n=1 Tax=Aliiglaciecola lipolytica E3 TaxID=1127673 RepID=K6YFF1_9ALTE|nr:hypothetical protein [Aliiglaciecola lipolytica]GAC15338.1 hypothetical protein GLIP_2716 [Aliiglaciecola lipolytica E3]